MSNLERKLREIAERVDKIILENLVGDLKVSKLYESSRYLFLGGGKRLRPSIVVLTSELVNGDVNRSYILGAAVEVLHTFTLIHDDIMDNDPIRRGMPSVHVKYGVPMAILAGDLLHVKAFEILHKGLKGLDQDKVNKGLEKFIEAIITISEGQALDMEFEEKKEVSEEEYFEMIKKKTA
ncbi:MAG: polyprenyl synthetase family protein, partial [Sulfolobaceae archaeon]